MTNTNTAKQGMATPAKKCRCDNQRRKMIENEDGMADLNMESRTSAGSAFSVLSGIILGSRRIICAPIRPDQRHDVVAARVSTGFVG